MMGRTLTLFSGITVLAVVCNSCAAAEILECYECFEGAGANMEKPLPVCSQLRNSPEFRVACPNSTMCLKTVSTINLQDGSKWSAVLRGCANQVKITHVLRNRFYEEVAVIDEPYKDGCIEKKDHNMLTSTVQQCYCRGNLCNSATYRDLNIPIQMIYIILLLRHLRQLSGI
nr:uncharacterized protein LOC6626712 [Drosophila virilis]